MDPPFFSATPVFVPRLSAETTPLKPFTQGSFTSLFFSDMGFSHSDLESESKKWVIAGIGVRSLKPINTKRVGGGSGGGDAENEEEEARSTTPTAKEARIPEKLPCPPAPRKRRPPPSRCGNGGGGGVREFFTPPDLESVFKCHVEKAK
ncbi:hypothetical protein JHK86_011400 [Glycine max]|nr:hypothetical protein JHK86_011400 [Glycine max]